MLERHYEKTGLMPKALESKPYPPAHLSGVLNGFNLLSRYRTWREGIPDPIDFGSVVHYANLNGIFDPDGVFDFCELITYADSAYIKHYIQESKRQIDAAKAKTK